MSESELYHVLYVSNAVGRLSDEDLQQIAQTSHENNVRNGVTGVLLHRDGTFLQLLEGPLEAIDETLCRIRRDPRHTDFRILFRGLCKNRNFLTSNMGVLSADSVPEENQAVLDEILDKLAASEAAPGCGTVDYVLTEIINQFAKFGRAA